MAESHILPMEHTYPPPIFDFFMLILGEVKVWGPPQGLEKG